jgi:hypothetical protein
MVSFNLHEKWAKRLGIDMHIVRKVNEIIDPHDIRGEGLIKHLKEKGIFNDDAIEAAILHHFLDCLRDLIKELGKEPTKIIHHDDLLEIAYGMCIDRGYSFLLDPFYPAKFSKVRDELKRYAKELIDDILQDIKGIKDVGRLHRINKKYIRWLMRKYEKLKNYSNQWNYSKLRS